MVHTLIVVYYITQMVLSGVMCFANAHRVVREVDIAVVAWILLALRLNRGSMDGSSGEDKLTKDYFDKLAGANEHGIAECVKGASYISAF